MKKEFYDKCASILGVEHEWREPVARRTRWNTRFLGNGRMEGYGIIRMFGPTSIHVAFHKPRVNRYFTSVDAVYEFLETVGPCKCPIVCMQPNNCRNR